MLRPSDAAEKLPGNLFRAPLLMWLLLIGLHQVTSFHRFSLNVVANLLTAEFSLTGTGLGNLAAAYTYMYVIMQIPGGMLVDRLGPRKIALFTGLTMAAGSLVIGFAPTAGMVFVGRLLIGLGGSVVLINIFKFQASWFRPGEFATMSGLAMFVSVTGALLAATPLAVMVNLVGWRASFIGFGVVTVAVSVLGGLFVRNSPGSAVAPSAPAAAGSEEPAKAAEILAALPAVLGNRRLWLPFIMNFGTFGGYIVFSGTWGVSYLVHVYGLSVEQASGFMVAALLGYMAGALLSGFVSDRIGSRKIPALIQVSCCVLFWLTVAAWPGGILPLNLLYLLNGLLGFSASCTVLSFTMAREVSPPGHTGIVTATVNLGVFLGLAVLQVLFGLVLDLGWQGVVAEGARVYPLSAYRVGFTICLIFAAAALAAILFVREERQKDPAS